MDFCYHKHHAERAEMSDPWRHLTVVVSEVIITHELRNGIFHVFEISS